MREKWESKKWGQEEEEGEERERRESKDGDRKRRKGRRVVERERWVQVKRKGIKRKIKVDSIRKEENEIK